MKGQWILATGIALFLGAGYGAWMVWKREHPPPPPPATTASEPASGTELRFDAKLRAQHWMEVTAPIEGIFAEAPIRPEEEVAEGQLLGRIQNTRLEEDQKELEAELETAISKKNAAESSLIAARLEESRTSADASRARSESQRLEKIYARQLMLFKEGATPRLVYEKAETDFNKAKTEADTLEDLARQLRTRIDELSRDGEAVRQAVAEKEAELENARQAVQASEVRSPVDGILIAITKQPGDEVRKGEPGLFQIATDLSLLEAVAEVPPYVIKRAQVGQAAAVAIAELPGEGLPATVSAVEDGKIVVQFASPSPLLRPGMSALVRFKLP